MKAITVRQPFAGLIAKRMKEIEVRSKPTKYRGTLVICSGKQIHPLYKGMLLPKSDLLGYAICTVELIDCHPFREQDAARACIDFIPGQWAWELRNARQIAPIAVSGKLGFFEVNISDMYKRMINVWVQNSDGTYNQLEALMDDEGYSIPTY